MANSRGQSAIEFALVAPLLFLALIGVVTATFMSLDGELRQLKVYDAGRWERLVTEPTGVAAEPLRSGDNAPTICLEGISGGPWSC